MGNVRQVHQITRRILLLIKSRIQCKKLHCILLIIERNRRASVSLSPVLIHFLAPQGKLYQRLLTLEQILGSIPPPLTAQERPGPKHAKQGIPSHEWPNVLRRVLENQDPLRQVAADYGVSRETVRRLLRTSRKKRAG